ncbi:MAG: isochorismatase family protein [Wenzhouxiangella sp.]
MAILEHAEVGIGKRPALLIIDVNNAFTDPDSGIGCPAEEVVAAIGHLLEVFRSNRLPVFYTTVAYSAAEQARVFRAKLPILDILEDGSHAVEIDPRVAPAPGETVLVKYWPSGFFKTELAERLEADGIDTVVITGLTTSGCVRATAVDALSHDFRVVVPREAVGDRDPPAHKANLHDIDCKYGDVLSVDETIELVQQAAAAGGSFESEN